MNWRYAWIGLALVPLAGCLNSADTAKVDAAEAQFFTQWQAKQYGPIYDGAAPELTGAVTKDAFVAMLQAVDERMGACQAPVKAADYHFNSDDKGYLATQGWSSTCANGKLDESVTIILRNGDAKLAGINFKSPALQGGGDASGGNATTPAAPAPDAGQPAGNSADSSSSNSE
ncbi:MAG TPA: hypothetical protein VHW60_06305 [Caulobacteraceae bacterium]|nr:hypothetical protein [Caulobacteraceae bacterium]